MLDPVHVQVTFIHPDKGVAGFQNVFPSEGCIDGWIDELETCLGDGWIMYWWKFIVTDLTLAEYAIYEERARQVYDAALESDVLASHFSGDTPLDEHRVWDVWQEGYSASGDRATAHFLGKFTGTWEEACKKSVADHPDHFQPNRFGPGRHAFWGCEFFDNEADARKSYG